MALIPGRTEILVSGRPRRLMQSSATMPTRHLIVMPLDGNTGNIWIGGENTRAVAGSEAGMMLRAKHWIRLDGCDLAEVWVDSTVDGDGVAWLAIT